MDPKNQIPQQPISDQNNQSAPATSSPDVLQNVVPAVAAAEAPAASVVVSASPTTSEPSPSDEVAGIPAAGRFDLSSIYPSASGGHSPAVVQPTAQQQTVQSPSSSVPQSSTGAVSTPAPTPFATYQQSDVLQSSEMENVSVPMKNIFIVGLVGPFATLGIYVALYLLVMFSVFKLFSGGGIGTGASSMLEFISNPGVQAAVLAGFLYLNIRITATYYEDLKIPRPAMAALFSVLLVFSTVAIGIKNMASGDPYSILTGFGGSYLLVILALFSGLFWYPLSVKWSLSPVESPMKTVYPYVAGLIIIIGIGIYLLALFNSSAGLQ